MWAGPTGRRLIRTNMTQYFKERNTMYVFVTPSRHSPVMSDALSCPGEDLVDDWQVARPAGKHQFIG